MSLGDCLSPGAAVSIVGVEPDGVGLALYDLERAEIDGLLAHYDESAVEAPQLLLVVSGLLDADTLEERFDLQTLRLLLDSPSWCRWVEVKTLSHLSTSLAQLAVIAGWLEAAGAVLRLRHSGLELDSAELPAIAATVLALEAVVYDFDLSQSEAARLLQAGLAFARQGLQGSIGADPGVNDAA